MIYLVGAADENEILLYNTLLALRDSLHLLFKYGPFKSRAGLRAHQVQPHTRRC